ncbi:MULTISPECIES: TIGR02301 family protein [unclassified Aureimonas]|uniref:TIGR02301 family protein n=1 Tax=unclassified Aureimonas TaxID=2615206 RepID=UPI0009EBBA0A|nr:MULTISPECIES: TIGR02301 family protein [unclassified Aureimonas]
MTERRSVSSLVPALLLAAALVAGGPVSAQEPPSSPDVPAAEAPAKSSAKDKAKDAEKAEEKPAATAPSNASFMKPLGRLSSILGSVHFLRTLCGDPGAAVWRQKMNELLDAQAPNEADRKILIASFNSGYRSFESTYRQCTPAARLAVSRYQAEGATLSREIGTRYGN